MRVERKASPSMPAGINMPLGMVMPGRSFSSENYRFGFNGMEKDDEVKGGGNSLDFGARIYDPRLARWLGIDPLVSKYPSLSPFSAFRNNPILFVDPDGKEWVNAHDAEVAQINEALLKNPNSKKLQRYLEKAIENQMKVNEVIKNLKKNDEALYNYIENLTVIDIKTNEKINVKVMVEIDYQSGKDGTEEASTKYKKVNSNGKPHFVEYDGLEGEFKVTGGPINSNNEIGFDIKLFTSAEWSDVYLSNEVGDVMFRMEYPDAAAKSGSDSDKRNASGTINWEKYKKPGSAGAYSDSVEETYKERKKSGSGKDPQNNPYPLKNE